MQFECMISILPTSFLPSDTVAVFWHRISVAQTAVRVGHSTSGSRNPQDEIPDTVSIVSAPDAALQRSQKR